MQQPAALAAGKHLLAESPMGVGPAGIESLQGRLEINLGHRLPLGPHWAQKFYQGRAALELVGPAVQMQLKPPEHQPGPRQVCESLQDRLPGTSQCQGGGGIRQINAQVPRAFVAVHGGAQPSAAVSSLVSSAA
jgi:hypothetical protein